MKEIRNHNKNSSRYMTDVRLNSIVSELGDAFDKILLVGYQDEVDDKMPGEAITEVVTYAPADKHQVESNESMAVLAELFRVTLKRLIDDDETERHFLRTLLLSYTLEKCGVTPESVRESKTFDSIYQQKSGNEDVVKSLMRDSVTMDLIYDSVMEMRPDKRRELVTKFEAQAIAQEVKEAKNGSKS